MLVSLTAWLGLLSLADSSSTTNRTLFFLKDEMHILCTATLLESSTGTGKIPKAFFFLFSSIIPSLIGSRYVKLEASAIICATYSNPSNLHSGSIPTFLLYAFTTALSGKLATGSHVCSFQPTHLTL